LRIYAYQSPQERLRRRGLIRTVDNAGKDPVFFELTPSGRAIAEKLPPKKRGRK
jgi:DNA-binding MarR family transcriptional regulator